MSQIECIGHPVDWQKSIRIKKYLIETWWLTLIGSHGSDDHAEANWFLADNISDDLILFLMDVTKELPSNDILVSVNNSVVSPTVSSEAFLDIWNMANNDGCAIDLFQLMKFILQPLEHTAGIVEIDEDVEVVRVADVGVDRDDLRVFVVSDDVSLGIVEGRRVVAPVQEVLLLVLGEESEPSRREPVDDIVLPWSIHIDEILRISVMITNAWINTDSRESVGNLDGCILNNFDVILWCQTLKVVRNSVASPKHGIRF